MLWIILLILILALSYYYLTKPYKYWKNQGVPQGSPVPIFGDVWRGALSMQPLTEMMTSLYNTGGPHSRYAGVYQLMQPVLMLKDPELIKQIAVKDFDHFLNHRNFFPDEVDKLWSKNLLVLKDERWKNMRVTLSPAFTSSKMKNMYIHISECAEAFTKYFLDKNEPIVEVEFKDIFGKYTTDVIASVAFGFKCDSLRDPKNEFFMMGKQLNFLGFWNNLKFFLLNLSPTLFKVLNMTFFPRSVTGFFRRIIKEAIELREKGEVVRQDMLQLLIDSRKDALKHEDDPSLDTGFATALESDDIKLKKATHVELTDEDITAQALVFFFGGFDSSSNLMCLIGYELAANPDIQKILQSEIDDTIINNKGKITYEALLKIKYLDMVVSETLRRWPNVVGTDRVVTKPYTIEPVTPEEKPVHLKVGDAVIIASYAIQNDPQYYPKPEVFDPERFNDENKGNINPYTYLPFGIGPRNCIGSRFALLETKTLFFHVLSKFDIVPVEKSKIPMVFENTIFRIAAKGGFWFGLKKREFNN